VRKTVRAIDGLLRAVGDPVAELRAVGPEHPEYPRAQLVRISARVLAKVAPVLPEISQALQGLRGPGIGAELREHLRAAQAWVDGDPRLAADRYAGIVSRRPGDLLALRLAQSCYFFMGEHGESRRVADFALRRWRGRGRSFAFVLAMASFAHAEAGDPAHAEALGRAALERDPACPFGVHAIAHAYAESGRAAAGARWMRTQHAQWAGLSRMCTHNAWHLAMFDVSAGEVESALNILDRALLPASEQGTLDACDAVALTFRIERAGVGVASRWQRLSDAFERSGPAGYWPFVDLHAALAYLAAGHRARFARLSSAIDHKALEASYAGRRARAITRPALRALRSWAVGNTAQAAALFQSPNHSLAGAGGSRSQLALFSDLTRRAQLRAAPLRRERLPGDASAPAACRIRA
jgi:hypothetical protein